MAARCRVRCNFSNLDCLLCITKSEDILYVFIKHVHTVIVFIHWLPLRDASPRIYLSSLLLVLLVLFLFFVFLGGICFSLLSALTAHRPTLPLGPTLKWKLPCFGLGFNGSAFSCLQYPITVWLPVILQSWHSSSVRFIWLPHASKEYFTLKIFLNFYMTLKCNEQRDQSTTLWWNACYFSYMKQTAANLRNMVSFFFRMN